jgi:hypothetical protein
VEDQNRETEYPECVPSSFKYTIIRKNFTSLGVAIQKEQRTTFKINEADPAPILRLNPTRPPDVLRVAVPANVDALHRGLLSNREPEVIPLAAKIGHQK